MLRLKRIALAILAAGFLVTSTQPTFCSELSSSADQALDVNTLEEMSNTTFWARDYKSSKDYLQKLIAINPLAPRYLVNLSICQAQLDDWLEARKNAMRALKLAPESSQTTADGLAIYARCLFMDGKIDKAIENYKKAITIQIKNGNEWNCDMAPVYEGLAGCYLKMNDLPKAEEIYKKVAQLDYLKYGPDETYLAWSFLSLSTVERQLHKDDLARELFKKVFWNFRYQNEKRILSELDAGGNKEIVDELRKQLYGYVGGYDNRELGLDYIKQGIPESVRLHPLSRAHIFDNWFKERVGREEAPGLAFFDPKQKLKALIVTVHGLGLHHGAFTPFAKQIQHQGYGVISFDVRGFGTYRNDEVYQRLDLDAAIVDLKRILTALRADYPGVPLILLGESMGGAIALRVAAVAPELVDAVVSSVPSGSRYHSKRTAFSIGLRLLKNKNKPFNIGKRVLDQATASPNLRDMWEGDPQMRMKLSPAELINFQRFMDDNLKYAEKIKNTPVIIFQGYSDNLVKPMGTLSIYQAIANKDKDLVFVGKAEHLIFEKGQFDPDIYDGVLSWMNKHLVSASKVPN